MISAADPWMLALGILIPIGLWLSYRKGNPGIVFSPAGLLSGAKKSWRVKMAGLPTALKIAGLLFLVLSLARPVQKVPLPRETSGIDIVLCLDVSSSMAAKDMDPARSRLELAKQAAAKFIAERKTDRIGLVRFARYPDVLSPLTLDHKAIQGFLEKIELVEADGQEDLTGIGTAVARAAQVLRGSLAKSKVIILLTDGEENVATARTPDEIAPHDAAKLCEAFGIRVYAIAAGIGKPDRKGEWITLDTTQVKNLADRTEGKFFAAKQSDSIAQIYQTINQMEKKEFEEPRFVQMDRFLPFLITALALLLFGWSLRSISLEPDP